MNSRSEVARPILTCVTNRQLARIHAALRVRLGVRQQDVAARAGIDRKRVGKLEAAQIDELTVGELRSCFEALGARVEVSAYFRGAALDRLLDEVHATTLGAVVAVLKAAGWEVRIEVTFSVDGERGSIDALAWHLAERALLVVEVKSEMPGIDPLLRPLDVKTRVAAKVAWREFGWRAASVSRVVVLPEDSTARRQTARHEAVLATALPARSREVRAWLRRPVGKLAGLWFLSLESPGNFKRNPSSVRRVRRPASRPAAASGTGAGGALLGPEPDFRLIDPHSVLGRRN